MVFAESPGPGREGADGAPLQLSVVVVNWNSGAFLANLIHSLQPLAADLEQIIVVDNASSDESRALLQRAPIENLRPLLLGRNRGFAGAANRAIARLHSPYILLLNADIQVRPASVRGLYQAMADRPKLAITCGPLVDHHGPQLNFQLRALPTPWSLFREVLFLDEVLALLGGRREAAALPAEPLEVEQPAAACWLLRRQAWQELGGFDERFYPAWFEDVDFCKRLQSAGWKAWFLPDCPIDHVGGVSLTWLGNRRFIDLYHENMLRYLRKHHPWGHRWLYLPVKLGALVRRLARGRGSRTSGRGAVRV